ncbi:MAG: response regulator, partial [Proteobacteria bacterium]
KFTERGSITLAVDLLNSDHKAVEFKIKVSDTGAGIPTSMQGRLFKAFEQANSSTSRRFGGTGLGLAITKNLASLMNGVIEFSSQDGEGSEFWVVLKLPKGKGIEIEKRRQDFNGDLSVFKGARILIAEDNKTNQTITRKVLQSLGVVCEVAENGHEVLALMMRAKFDLILMDCQMPGMDGFQATETIRAFSDSSKASIPIIGFTAGAMKADRDDRDRCMTSGMDDYLSKPANKAALVQKLGPTLEKVASLRAA